jgi:hypothetical protein
LLRTKRPLVPPAAGPDMGLAYFMVGATETTVYLKVVVAFFDQIPLPACVEICSETSASDDLEDVGTCTHWSQIGG